MSIQSKLFVLGTLAVCLISTAVAQKSGTLRGKQDSETEVASAITTTPDQMRAKVVRLIDEYVVVFNQSLGRMLGDEPAPDDRYWVRTMILINGSAGFSIAAGDRPLVNLLDTIVLVSLTRTELEDYWKPERFGERLDPVIAALRKMENEVWKVAAEVLTEAHQTQLKALIRQWRIENPEVQYTAFIRFREFADAIKDQPESKSGRGPASVFSLLYIDPLAGLDPTVRAIEQSKLLGERLMYFAERLPYVLRWQGLLFINDTVRAPEVQSILESIDRFSRAAESISDSVAELPVTVDAQREAAINQLLDGVARERAALLAYLEDEEAQLRGVIGDVRMALDSGDAMAKSVDAVILSVNDLISPEPNAPPKPPPDPNAPPPEPFRILDYADTARQLGEAADRINLLVNSIDDHAPGLMDDTSASLKSLANHIFLLLIGLAIVVFGLALLYRRLVRPRPGE